jgi:hypothetical protein
MRVRTLAVWVTLSSFLVATPLRAQQQHVVDSSALQQAIVDARTTDAANRQTVERVLARPQVQQAADKLGLDIRRAESALKVMTSEELAKAAAQAKAVEMDLAGGDSTITISLTALLIIILLVVLIAD